VLAEVRAALEPRLKAAAFRCLEDFERVRDGSHRALLDTLHEIERVTGSGDPRAGDLLWPHCTVPVGGAADLITYRRQYFETQVRWTA